ncbi:hypothetical protein S40285_01715 [Stachybotrys chlorohalonatus IBT 40285]|uniref:Epoxide hydrolase N-terminal domain-containing protein n=1 Tax=Stachybotrys chlorohalonatus (strain IBT 40285) TaxID=1283841 RepID=A0A084QDY7_STAC4|nr:hypothetical protein S40285_01715 [Stachybotrys chlorohalonata IBT 40285]
MAASHDALAVCSAGDEEVRPYQIHVSSRYLDLTREKLELTRLPHEVTEPRAEDWWAPKTTVEPLVDYWQEQYSWRDTEKQLNADLPQFRTGIRIGSSETPCRVHFVHVRSPHANAVPLLLIPPFPFTNLSLGHLVTLFTDPDDAGQTQPFHLVIPSLPGLGFSDALPNNTPLIPTTADMWDTLMKRLEYEQYIATTSGPCGKSPSEIDWRLANYLANNCSKSCLGVHLISPPLTPPTLQESMIEWAKWKIALLFQVALFGYSRDDFTAWNSNGMVQPVEGSSTAAALHFGLRNDGFYDPNTLSYALCDSPVGLLLFFLLLTRMLGPRRELAPAEIITLTELTWLPGPEATFRFWAYCSAHREQHRARSPVKPKIAVTVFLGDKTTAPVAGQQVKNLPQPIRDAYAPPTWATVRYNVVSTSRESGNPGLLAWERPELIVSGARKLAKEILKTDTRMRKEELPGIALLQQVVVGNERATADISGTTVQSPIRSSSDVQADAAKKIPSNPDNKFLSPTQALAEPRKSDAPGGSPQIKVSQASGTGETL